jgi:hypothetical protein
MVDATKGLDIFMGKLIIQFSIWIIDQLISSCLKTSRQKIADFSLEPDLGYDCPLALELTSSLRISSLE